MAWDEMGWEMGCVGLGNGLGWDGMNWVGNGLGNVLGWDESGWELDWVGMG